MACSALPQGEHAVVVTAHHTQAADGQRLGGVSLSQDERAHVGVAAARIVGVVQLGDTYVCLCYVCLCVCYVCCVMFVCLRYLFVCMCVCARADGECQSCVCTRS